MRVGVILAVVLVLAGVIGFAATHTRRLVALLFLHLITWVWEDTTGGEQSWTFKYQRWDLWSLTNRWCTEGRDLVTSTPEDLPMPSQ